MQMATEEPDAELELIDDEERRVGPQYRMPGHLLALEPNRLEVHMTEKTGLIQSTSLAGQP